MVPRNSRECVRRNTRSWLVYERYAQDGDEWYSYCSLHAHPRRVIKISCVVFFVAVCEHTLTYHIIHKWVSRSQHKKVKKNAWRYGLRTGTGQ